jgi:signal transduction histidine kinase
VVRRALVSLSVQAAERQVRVELEVATDLPPVPVDGARMEQVFVNLIANAIQHSPAGGRVRVRAGLDPARLPAAVRCSVEDQGPGIPQGLQARVFEPFFTRRKGGTGLGLSIVQRVVQAHGGDIVTGPGEEPGACFTLWLPLGAATTTAT